MTGTPNVIGLGLGVRVRISVRISLLGLGSRDIELIQQRDIGRSGYRALPQFNDTSALNCGNDTFSPNGGICFMQLFS
jgi:hypothetical protein